MFCTSGPNLVIVAWAGDKLSSGKTDDWRTHTHTYTHTHRQTQATTIPEGHNWPRVKKSSWIKAWISNYIHVQQRDLITHPCPNFSSSLVNSLRLSDAIWWQRSGSTLAQVMACCLMAPSHYLNQCWLIISEVLWQSYDGNITRDTSAFYY